MLHLLGLMLQLLGLLELLLSLVQLLLQVLLVELPFLLEFFLFSVLCLCGDEPGNLRNGNPILSIPAGIILGGKMSLLNMFAELLHGVRAILLLVFENINIHG